MPCSVLLMVQTRESDERAVHERTVRYDYRYTSVKHVSLACQLFQRRCFEEIGGYISSGTWLG